MRKTVFAPAKINLCLHVLGKRPDGYHELVMLMQRVSLFDHLEIALVDEPGIRVACDGLVLAEGEENIVARAARLMLEVAGSCRGVEISLQKNIPVAAGLGGGSSDAAAVLTALNEMLGLEMSSDDLMAEGVKLGADVPFFVFGKTAWATGVGERLEEAPIVSGLWYVLVNPGFAVSTAWAYQNLGLTSIGEQIKLPRFSGTTEDLVALLHNDLERVTASYHPVIAEAKGRLEELGALGALMSGSGATVFGVFDAEDAARDAATSLAGATGWLTFVVEPI